MLGVTSLLAMSACGGSAARVPPATALVAPDQLNRLMVRYAEEYSRVNPRSPVPPNDLAPQYLADSLDLERRYLNAVNGLSREGLDTHSRLTLDIFKRQRELRVEGYTYPSELMPLNPFEALTPASSPRMSQILINMREGLRRGYMLPQVVVARSLAQLGNAADEAPAYALLRNFLKTEYLPRARATVGLQALPLGEAWYAYRVRSVTGTGLTPAAIHKLGLLEVGRIKPRLLATLAISVAQHQPMRLYTTPQELVDSYKELKTKVLALMPNLFAQVPADFDIRAMDAGVASHTALNSPKLFFQSAEPGSVTGPAHLIVNTADLANYPAFSMEALFLREAVPGNVLQMSLPTGAPSTASFRPEHYPAFEAGWALYAQSLGDELGLYRDPDAKIAALSANFVCALSAVIDTGLHLKGWTRRQALEYLRAQMPPGLGSALDADSIVDRSIALPAEALACKVGEIKIRALRDRAEKIWGTDFDIRDFHTQILQDGAMPLDILELKIEEWIKSPHKAHQSQSD